MLVIFEILSIRLGAFPCILPRIVADDKLIENITQCTYHCASWDVAQKFSSGYLIDKHTSVTVSVLPGRFRWQEDPGGTASKTLLDVNSGEFYLSKSVIYLFFFYTVFLSKCFRLARCLFAVNSAPIWMLQTKGSGTVDWIYGSMNIKSVTRKKIGKASVFLRYSDHDTWGATQLIKYVHFYHGPSMIEL